MGVFMGSFKKFSQIAPGQEMNQTVPPVLRTLTSFRDGPPHTLRHTLGVVLDGSGVDGLPPAFEPAPEKVTVKIFSLP